MFSIFFKKKPANDGRPLIISEIPFVFAREKGGDAITCFAMLLHYFGHTDRLSDLRKRFPQFKRVSTLQSLIDLALVYNLKSRALHCPIEEAGNLRLPCIIHWNENQFLLLLSIADDGISVRDPLNKRSWYSKEEFEIHYSEVALEIYSE